MMMYPWPLAEANATLGEALEIAMGFLEGTGQAYPYSETQVRTANAILAAWRSGVRQKIRLANIGINAVVRKQEPRQIEQESFYPRVV